MANYCSKLGNHIFAKDCAEAVRLYKLAFKLETESEPWLDDDGLIIHQDLLRNGETFLSVSENKYLPDSFIEKFSDKGCPPMLFCVYFNSKNDLCRTVEILVTDGSASTDLQEEGDDVICDLIDKFGVFWHLRFPKNQNSSFIPK